nr:glutathione S transferase mu 2 [Hymenolepis microstoma]
MAPALGYWDIRGLAEPIRLLLRYLGADFQEKLYHPGPAPDFDSNEWLEEKFKLGLEFPNLPYYIDGDFKLTQSAAILEYIADTHNMIPSCKKQRAVLHMLFNTSFDLVMKFGIICYSPDFDNLRGSFLKSLPDSLRTFEEYLGDKTWLTGDKINYPDFSLCELLNELEKFEPSCLSEFPKLKAYLTRFENLPELKEYIFSEEFKKRDCMGRTAKWRNNS